MLFDGPSLRVDRKLSLGHCFCPRQVKGHIPKRPVSNHALVTKQSYISGRQVTYATLYSTGLFETPLP